MTTYTLKIETFKVSKHSLICEKSITELETGLTLNQAIIKRANTCLQAFIDRTSDGFFPSWLLVSKGIFYEDKDYTTQVVFLIDEELTNLDG